MLENRRTIVLGEPGAGKSTVAKAAVRVALDKGWIPLFVSLQNYRGDLAGLIAQAVSPDVPADLDVPRQLTLFYVLDGFDELRPELVQAFIDDFAGFSAARPSSRFLLTSRQAFYATRRHLFAADTPAFYVLDLQTEDIHAFIRHRRVDRVAFMDAASRAGLSGELSNPFALLTLLTLFASKGALGETRSEAVDYVIRATLASRPTADPKRELQALRMLALAMEMAARNELTERAALEVIKLAFRVDDAAAHGILKDLAQSILIRTQDGYAFQMRSYGEYLAAKELADVRERDRLLEPLFLAGTREPHDSWRNSVSYLAELNKSARSYFTERHPDWLVKSAPAIFSDEQKSRITRGLVRRLNDRREYLHRHPLIRLGPESFCYPRHGSGTQRCRRFAR